MNEDNLDNFLVDMGDDNGNVRGRGGYNEGEGSQGIVSEAQITEASETSSRTLL